MGVSNEKKSVNPQVCINRDKNGCRNIQRVFNYYKKTGKRPMKYSREYKYERIDQPPKPYNEEKKGSGRQM